MPIRMTRRGNVAAPVVMCDFCGRVVDDAELAWYEWLEGPKGPPTGEVYFLHKKCIDQFEEAHPPKNDESWANMEMVCLPIYLGNGMHLNWDQAKKLASEMGG